MGKVVKFPGSSDEETRPLSREEVEGLIEPLKEGLKRLYPTQVSDVLGVIGLGERKGAEVLMAGFLLWEGPKTGGPALSTFLALFINERLEKISFLEAKKNYWDWDLMVKTNRGKFHVDEMLKTLSEIREKMGWGSG